MPRLHWAGIAFADKTVSAFAITIGASFGLALVAGQLAANLLHVRLGRCTGKTGSVHVFLLLLVLFAVPAHCQEAGNDIKHILIAHEIQSTAPATTEVMAGIYRQLGSSKPAEYQLYVEYLDLDRFHGSDQEAALARLLATKYRDVPIDIVMVFGSVALKFMVENRNRIAPEKPIVFGAVSRPTVEKLQLTDDVTGYYTNFDTRDTIDVAIRLQPNAERVVVFSGSSPSDQRWIDTAREQLDDVYAGIPVSYVTDLEIDEFVKIAKTLSKRTILLLLTFQNDPKGVVSTSADVAGRIAVEAGVPSYGVYSVYIGRGVVGGFIVTFDLIGASVARSAQRILSGSAPEEKLAPTQGQPVVDWRQLQRWGIGLDRLPENTNLQYFQPNLWQQYRWQIMGIIAIILLQSGTIVALITTDRRRRQIKDELALERLELAHLSRANQLGELSGSFAHELNQPLTSILANAQAGAELMKKDEPDLKEIAEILEDIVADDKRAADIISQLKSLMKKGEVELSNIDLNAVTTSSLALVKSELVSRKVRAKLDLYEDSLPIYGNIAQLQQIVLNLVINAADAMAEISIDQRRMRIATSLANGIATLSVTDNGPGLDDEVEEKAFMPFVSTKPQGLGLGLAICRSIARAHGGTLRFDGIAKGARIVLSIPLAASKQ